MANEQRKRRPGRPALLEELPSVDICARVTRLAKLGCTHETIAGQLGIAISTFYKWIKEHPQFSKAVKAGEIDADANMASAMYAAGTGNKRVVQVVTKIKNGPDRETTVVDEIIIEDPLNVSAQIFWLKNRRRDLWRDVRSNEMSGPDGRAIEMRNEHVIDARQLDAEERAKLRAFLEANVTDVEDQNETTEEQDQ